MGVIEGVWLGIVQGLTEFLPVSSSGHVVLTGLLLGEADMPLALVVVLHIGTLLATVLVLRPEIAQLAREMLAGLRQPAAWADSDPGRVVLGVVVATVPTALIGLGLEPYLDGLGRYPEAVGAAFLVTAATLLATRNRPREGLRVLPLWGYLLIGVAQGLAVTPGISRSGATIAAAMLLGLGAADAFRFSFLLSLPAIAGATLLEAKDLGNLGALGPAATAGGAAAFVVGWLCLVLLRRLVVAGRLWVFALYLVPLGLGLIAWRIAGPG